MLLVLVACLLLAANAQDSQDNCPAQPCRTATLEGGKCVYSVVPAGSSCSAVDPVTLKPVNGFCSSSGFCQTSCPVIQCQTATLFSFGCSYSPKSVGSACQNTSTSGSALGTCQMSAGNTGLICRACPPPSSQCQRPASQVVNGECQYSNAPDGSQCITAAGSAGACSSGTCTQSQTSCPS